jgi:hypothetical protein
MATTPVEFRAPSGLTLTLELFAYGSDTVANTGGDSATEETNREGVYQASVTEALSGWYTAHILSGSTTLAVYDVYMVDDTSVHRCFDRSQDLAQETVADVTATVSADVVSVSGDSTAADNLEAACDGDGYNIGGGSVVAASVTGAVGSVTGNVGGIAGTITTLDALDTAQDSQHSTTQSAISGLNDPTTAAIADAVWLEAIADHSGTSGSTAEALNAAGAAGDPWTTALPGAYGAGSAGYIVGNNLDAAASTLATAAALATVDANVDAILVDTGTTLPATLTTIEGKIDTVDTVADAILVDTGTTLPATLTTIEGKVDTIDGIVDAIVIDTAEIGAAGAGLTAITDAITALNDPTAAAIATAVLTTQMTESYAADGVAPTLAQAVFLIQQGLLERAVSGTTETIKKLDKSTTAATYSLDDPDAPTSKTRAT